MKPARITGHLTAPAQWETLPWGIQSKLALEQELRPWFGKIFGFHLLKIGNLSTEINTEDCAISHQVNMAQQGDNLQVQANPLYLPFAEKSVDACLLAHTLNWCSDPHRLLREADRVLIDDGWLIISSYNPISVAGLGKLIPVLRKRPPFNSRMFTSMRLLDWLSLLNFEVMYRRGFQVLPWHKQGGKMLSTHFPALGTMQVIVARKRTLPLTINPLKNRQKNKQIHSAVGATKQYRETIKVPKHQADSPRPRDQV